MGVAATALTNPQIPPRMPSTEAILMAGQAALPADQHDGVVDARACALGWQDRLNHFVSDTSRLET
jgi:hypothetical protein